MLSRIITFIGLLISVAGVILLIAGSRALAAERTLTFKAWKADKITVCNARLKTLRTKFGQAKSGRDRNWTRDLEQDLTQEKWRLEVAKDLSVKDYMILYVMPQLPEKGANRRLKEIASVLSREEVAQVLETYVQLLSAPQASQAQMRIQALANDR